jgi:hypothetical protein
LHSINSQIRNHGHLNHRPPLLVVNEALNATGPLMMSPQIASSYNQLRTHSLKRIVDAKHNNQHRKSPQNSQQQRKRGGKSPSSFDPFAIDTLHRKIQESDSKPHLSGSSKMKVDAKQVVRHMSAATKNFQWEKSLELIQCAIQRMTLRSMYFLALPRLVP